MILAKIEPTNLYDDEAIYVAFGIERKDTSQAKQDGTLRYATIADRTLYLGQWIVDWLGALGDKTQ